MHELPLCKTSNLAEEGLYILSDSVLSLYNQDFEKIEEYEVPSDTHTVFDSQNYITPGCIFH
jgi:dTDP-glucose pyrophosphorylase